MKITTFWILSCGKHLYQTYFRYTIPEGTHPENVTSNLAADGVLVIKALKGDPTHEIEIQKALK